ncbi:unnamed protein product [Calicophoron daubneyi]|uniref:BAH domain-containing protein n=1 Tax=Calicophoron daubneyi TaxID=300641 RepID=A0AAV2TEH6_CALDB
MIEASASASIPHHKMGESTTLSFSGDPVRLRNRPPTPDIRKVDLDLADLSDGTRVLLVEDKHLRAGTLYVGSLDTGSGTRNVSPAQLRDTVFRLHLDPDRPPVECSELPYLQSDTTSESTLGTQVGSPIVTAARKEPCQKDHLLQGWQIVQQAVLEVFPISMRNIPPGTRVCAPRVEHPTGILYPGTVAQPRSDEQVLVDHAPIDFDDSDHRQVRIHDIRLLPEHFTNFYDVANPFDCHVVCELMPECVDLTPASSTEFKLHDKHPGGVESPAETSTKRQASRRLFRLNEDLASTSGSGNLSVGSDSPSCPKQPRTGDNVSKRGLRGQTNSKSAAGRPAPDWSVVDKRRRRKKGQSSCRSIMRNSDKLVVSVGDSVEFKGSGDEIYLGVVQDIRLDESADAPVVVAAWYYKPTDMGDEGKIVSHIKGALFATKHTDENGARCIIGLANVVSSYKDFCALYPQEEEGPSAEAKSKFGSSGGGAASEQTNPKPSCSSWPYKPATSTETADNSAKIEIIQLNTKTDESRTTDVGGDRTDEGSVENETKSVGTSNTIGEVDEGVYFVAGKYDPVNHRITSWDVDLAWILNPYE